MQMRLAHKDDSAWAMGDYAYDAGDTLEQGKLKAAGMGIRPCSNEYAAFMTAFARRVRMKQVSPLKLPANGEQANEAEPGIDALPAAVYSAS